MRFVAVLLALASAALLHEFSISRLTLDQALAIAKSGKERGNLAGHFRSVDTLLQDWEYRTARVALQRLAEDDNPEAMFRLGEFHRLGYGMDEDQAAAFQWQLAAAQGGYEPAYIQTGYRLTYGIGTDRDLTEAERWHRKAIEAKDTRGYAQLAATLLQGERMQGERTRAEIDMIAALLDRGMEAGDEYAAIRKISAWFEGDFGPIDPDAVAELHKWLALRGHTDAMENLIWMLRNTGPTAFRHPHMTAAIHDPQEAYKWTLIALSHWTDTENGYFDPASSIPLILLENYRELLDRSVGPGGRDIQNRQPMKQFPPHPARAELQRATADARRRLAERARIVLSNPDDLPPLPEIPEMPYRLDHTTIFQAERAALQFLESKPFGAE